jgi:hypothetical protein
VFRGREDPISGWLCCGRRRLIIRLAAADQRELTPVANHCKRERPTLRRMGRAGKAGIFHAVGTGEERLDDPLLAGRPNARG